MNETLKQLAERGCDRALAIAVEVLDRCLAEGAIEAALSGKADGIDQLMDARDEIIDAIAYYEGEEIDER